MGVHLSVMCRHCGSQNIVKFGRAPNGIWFLPTHSASPAGSCVSTEGARPPWYLTVPWPGSGQEGAVSFPVTPRSIDVPKWSKPFRIAFRDEKCPNYDPESTISCSYVVEGKLNLTRVDRVEEANGAGSRVDLRFPLAHAADVNVNHQDMVFREVREFGRFAHRNGQGRG